MSDTHDIRTLDAPPPSPEDERRRARRALVRRAVDASEVKLWMEMLGLDPAEGEVP